MRRLSVFLALLLAACAPAAQTTDTSVGATASTTTAASPGLLGDYTATLSASDFPASAPAEMRSQASGVWRLAFHPGNHFVVSHNGSEVVQGHYRLDGNRIMFSTGETGPYACNTPATYTWNVSNGQLTLSLVGSDECQGRIMAITSRPFTRVP